MFLDKQRSTLVHLGTYSQHTEETPHISNNISAEDMGYLPRARAQLGVLYWGIEPDLQ